MPPSEVLNNKTTNLCPRPFKFQKSAHNAIDKKNLSTPKGYQLKTSFNKKCVSPSSKVSLQKKKSFNRNSPASKVLRMQKSFNQKPMSTASKMCSSEVLNNKTTNRCLRPFKTQKKADNAIVKKNLSTPKGYQIKTSFNKKCVSPACKVSLQKPLFNRNSPVYKVLRMQKSFNQKPMSTASKMCSSEVLNNKTTNRCLIPFKTQKSAHNAIDKKNLSTPKGCQIKTSFNKKCVSPSSKVSLQKPLFNRNSPASKVLHMQKSFNQKPMSTAFKGRNLKPSFNKKTVSNIKDKLNSGANSTIPKVKKARSPDNSSIKTPPKSATNWKRPTWDLRGKLEDMKTNLKSVTQENNALKEKSVIIDNELSCYKETNSLEEEKICHLEELIKEKDRTIHEILVNKREKEESNVKEIAALKETVNELLIYKGRNLIPSFNKKTVSNIKDKLSSGVNSTIPKVKKDVARSPDSYLIKASSKSTTNWKKPTWDLKGKLEDLKTNLKTVTEENNAFKEKTELIDNELVCYKETNTIAEEKICHLEERIQKKDRMIHEILVIKREKEESNVKEIAALKETITELLGYKNQREEELKKKEDKILLLEEQLLNSNSLSKLLKKKIHLYADPWPKKIISTLESRSYMLVIVLLIPLALLFALLYHLSLLHLE